MLLLPSSISTVSPGQFKSYFRSLKLTNQGEQIPAEHKLVSSYLRINFYEIHTHFSTSFTSCTSEISIHSYFFLTLLARGKILSENLKCGLLYKTAFVWKLRMSYQYGSTTGSGTSLLLQPN